MKRRTSLVIAFALAGGLAGTGSTALAASPSLPGVHAALGASVIGQRRGDDTARQRAEAQRRAQEARQRAEAQRRAQEARQRAEAQRRAQEARQRADAQRRAQEARQRADAQRRAQEARQRADAQRRAQEARQRADAQRRAQESRQRADAQRRAQESRQRADAQRRAQESRQRADAQRRAQESRQRADAQRRAQETQRSSDNRRSPGVQRPTGRDDLRRGGSSDGQRRDIRRPSTIDLQNDRARRAEEYRRQLQLEHLRRRLETEQNAAQNNRGAKGPSAPPTLIYRRGEAPSRDRDVVNAPLGTNGGGVEPLFGKGLSDDALGDLNDERRRRRMQQQLGGAPINGGVGTGVGVPPIAGGDDPIYDPPPPGPSEGGLIYEYEDDEAVYIYNNEYYYDEYHHHDHHYHGSSGWSGWGWPCNDWYGYGSGWSFSFGYSSSHWGFSFGYSSYKPYHHHHSHHHHHHWKPSWSCWSGYKPYYWHTPIKVYHYTTPVVYWPKTTYVSYSGYSPSSSTALIYDTPPLPDINDGWEALRFGQLEQAFAVFDDLTYVQPTAAAPRIGLSLTKALQLDHDGAVLEMRRAFTDDPTAAYLVPGDTRMKDVIAVAVERYVTQVRIDRSDVDALFMIGALRLLRQEFPDGYYAVDAAIRSGDEHVSAYNLRTELDKAMFNQF